MKINFLKTTFFSILFPILLGYFLVQVKVVQGGFYLGTNIDPSYAYLVNAMNIAYGHTPGHVDHPGTILQYLGAIVLKITYWIDGQSLSLMEDVLRQPEKYLNILANVIIFLNVLVSFSLAILAKRLMNKWWIGIYLQIVPFFFLDLYAFNILKIGAESLMWMFAAGFSFLTILFFFRDNQFTNRNTYIFSCVLILTLAVNTKITFAPFALMPLLLIQEIKKKMYFLLISFLLFVLFTLPAFFSYEYLFTWVKGLLFNSERYGKGKSDFVNKEKFLLSTQNILQEQVFVLIPIFLILLFAVILHLKRKQFSIKELEQYKKLQLLYLGLGIIGLVSYVFIAKHYDPRYLIPWLTFSWSILPVFYCFIQEKFEFKKIFLVLPLSIMFLVGYKTKEKYDENLQKISNFAQSCLTIQKEAGKITNEIILSYRWHHSLPYALNFGYLYAGNMQETYVIMSKQIYPNFYMMQPDQWCYQFSERISVQKIIDANINKSKKILLIGDALIPNDKIKIFISEKEIKEFSVRIKYKDAYNKFIYELIY